MDVEAFGDRRRTNVDQFAVRAGLFRALRVAFDRSQVPWSACYHEDRGDGAFILVPPEIPKSRLIAELPAAMGAALRRHNESHRAEARIRLRLAIHAGEIHRDDHGAVGTALNFTFRLLEAEPLRTALSRSTGVIAVITSEWFFEEVVRQDPVHRPSRYRRVTVSSKETRATAWVFVPDDPEPSEETGGASHRAHANAAQPNAAHANAAQPNAAHPNAHATGSSPHVVVPRQLPPAPARFAGRIAELDTLTRLVEESARADNTPTIVVIEGTAGIGKTALALTWAHRVADQFLDGQIYVNLRGFDPTGTPMPAAEAVRGFLDAFNVPESRIPVGRTGQAAMYRGLVADRRMLLLLDNAHDTAQVRPLLASFPGCVLVTSRNQLTGLITAEGAYSLPLNLLTIEEARRLLAGRIGADRVTAEPGPVNEIIAACARLPLTLSIVAARAATHPRFALSTIAGELRDARGGLDAFAGGELDADARAVFSWSYEQLDLEAAELFRLLALHPGPDFTVPAAASLAGLPPRQARRTLGALARSHLIEEPSPGRFAYHDLLRVYAKELAFAQDDEPRRRAALCRVLDHYLHTGNDASLKLYPGTEPLALPPPRDGTAKEEVADHAAAWLWFEANLPVMLACVQQAAMTDCGAYAWLLPWTLVEYLRRSGRWHEWLATHRTAMAAAQRAGDHYAQARAHQGIGRASWRLGRYKEAQDHLQRALDMFAELESRDAEVVGTHLALSTAFEHLGSNEEALRHAEMALELSVDASDRLWAARALNRVGWYHALLGHPGQARTECRQALAELRGFDDRYGEARVLDSLGYACHLLGDHESAYAHLEQSLALRRELGDRNGEATVLTHLGDTYHATGNISAAHTAWRNALKILTEIAHPDVAQVSARLSENP